MQTIRRLVLAISLVALVVTPMLGCAPKTVETTPATPAQSVAKYAYKALVSVNEVQKLVIAADAQKVIPESASVAVMKFAYSAGDAGEKLAVALDAYELLTNPEQIADAARNIAALIATFDAALVKITGVSLGPSLAAQVIAVVANAQAALTSLRAEIAKFRASHQVQLAIALGD